MLSITPLLSITKCTVGVLHPLNYFFLILQCIVGFQVYTGYNTLFRLGKTTKVGQYSFTSHANITE